jgi:hypothetical protein
MCLEIRQPIKKIRNIVIVCAIKFESCRFGGSVFAIFGYLTRAKIRVRNEKLQ